MDNHIGRDNTYQIDSNTYQYDLSNPLDRIKYKSDPQAKIRDSIGNQYIRELELILGQSGGGILSNNSGVVKWNNIPTIQPFSGFGSF